MKPATPLPWFDCGMNWVRQVDQEPNAPQRNMAQDSLYAAHAANAYPHLVDALKQLCLPGIEGRGHVVPTLGQVNAARFLLSNLGELK